VHAMWDSVTTTALSFLREEASRCPCAHAIFG
jgi:hypothetical protein